MSSFTPDKMKFGISAKVTLSLVGVGLLATASTALVASYASSVPLPTSALLTTAGVIFLFSGLLGAFLGRFLTKPITSLQQTINALVAGNDTARATVVSQDEIGSVAASLNQLLDEKNFARDRLSSENQSLQQNIQDMLITVSDASDGKLDVRAKVSEGALGNLADALNLMLENVGDIVRQAKYASEEVAFSADQIENTAELLNRSAGQQVEEMSLTHEGVNYLSDQANHVLENCRQATAASDSSHASAAEGYRAVQEVMSGMQRIREIVQANSKKIKRLGDRSQEISQIVKFISEISAKTDILALNASIEASRAGEQGRGFTVVAEEVRGLADRTRTLTGQIEGLVAAIQTETAEAVAQMEAQTDEVERGTRTALGAGQAMETIVASSENSARIMSEINKAAVDQAASTERMKTSVEQINRLVSSTQVQVSQASGISRSLAELSRNLTTQLDSFETLSN